MCKNIFILLVAIGSLYGNGMMDFVSSHIPFRQDGKIDIPVDVKHIKIDVGLSYSAPMSQQWLSHEKNLWVFGFEPNIAAVKLIKNGAVKQNPCHGDPLDVKYIGKNFFLIPCALGRESGKMDFYITKPDCGCSSFYWPKNFEVEKTIQVPIFKLESFLELMPFDTHPVIDYIKIDAQGSDLDIVKSGGHYLEKNVIYITIEPENAQYENTKNSIDEIDAFMQSIGFIRIFSLETSDPTYLNSKFTDYVKDNNVTIFQKG